MAPNGSTRGAARYYPSSAAELSDLTLTQQRLKLARHSPCTNAHASSSRDTGRPEVHVSTRSSGRINNSRRGTPADEKEGHGHYFANASTPCACRGFRPPPGAKVKSLSVHTQSAAALDDAQWGWETCACGHDISTHGIGANTVEPPSEDFTRRAKAALRMDELLEDNHKLLDFDYDDEDLASLRKQVVYTGASPARPHARVHSNGSTLKRKSRSPTGSRLSSVEPSVPSREASVSRDSPMTKRRRMQSRSQTASRAVSPTSQTEGHGHGKKPTQAQKTLPETQDETVIDDIAVNGNSHNGHAEPEEDVEKVEVTGADLDRLAKGVSLDTEAPGPTAVKDNADDLDESAPPVRERPAVIEERSGLIQFRVVTNDGKPESMIILTGLKNIFQRQLPKMPREYITRLVMDRNHWSMAIVKRGLQVVGGITYRPFNSRRFAEIVFCAITSTEQVKGYGSHLMNHVKDHVKSASDVMHFLTYADNYAIGYFKKQGFSKEISLDRSIWVGYIKDYEGGTLMQCSMLPRVEYLKARELLAAQRQLILSKIRSISKSHIVYPGLDVFRTPKPKVEDTADNNDPTANFRIDPSEVPGLKESAWTVEMDELSRRPRRGPHHNLMRHILVEMSNHQAAWPFATPVNAQDVPDYYEVIKEPMDLSTMEVKLENNQYASLDDLLHDAQLIFDNCRMYNPPTSVYAKSANRLERFVKDSLQAWKQQAGIL